MAIHELGVESNSETVNKNTFRNIQDTELGFSTKLRVFWTTPSTRFCFGVRFLIALWDALHQVREFARLEGEDDPFPEIPNKISLVS